MNNLHENGFGQLKKGSLSLFLFACFVYVLLQKEISIDLSLSRPRLAAQLVDTDNIDPENKEPSVLSSLFPQSRRIFKNELKDISEKKQLKYINRFGHIAVKEMKKYGIPASVILASALLHSQAGQAPMSQEGTNNHFGIPCTDDWHNESSEYKGRCFRHYDNAWMSFRDHSLFITSERFPATQNLNTRNFKAWTKALEQSKYSPYPKLSKKLLQIIVQYNLNSFDK